MPWKAWTLAERDINRQMGINRYRQTDRQKVQRWRRLVDRKGEQQSSDLCGHGVKDKIETAQPDRCHHG